MHKCFKECNVHAGDSLRLVVSSVSAKFHSWTEAIENSYSRISTSSAPRCGNNSPRQPQQSASIPRPPPCWALLALSVTEGSQVFLRPEPLNPRPPAAPRQAKNVFRPLSPSHKATRPRAIQQCRIDALYSAESLPSAETSRRGAHSLSAQPPTCAVRAKRQQKLDSVYSAPQQRSSSQCTSRGGRQRPSSRAQAHETARSEAAQSKKSDGRSRATITSDVMVMQLPFDQVQSVPLDPVQESFIPTKPPPHRGSHASCGSRRRRRTTSPYNSNFQTSKARASTN